MHILSAPNHGEQERHFPSPIEVLTSLSRPPYFLLVRGTCDSIGSGPVEKLLVAASLFGRPHATGTVKMSRTRVRIDADVARRTGPVTHYSRTSLPLPAHTDSTTMDVPHDLVAFCMIRPDPAGGDSFVVSSADVLKATSPSDVALLKTPVSFGKRSYPVLSQGVDPAIRYYEAQIDRGSMDRDTAAVLSRLDALLAQPGLQHRFRLQAGDVLFLNNRKALHGRTGFSADSDRLMHRFRIHVPALSMRGGM